MSPTKLVQLYTMHPTSALPTSNRGHSVSNSGQSSTEFCIPSEIGWQNFHFWLIDIFTGNRAKWDLHSLLPCKKPSPLQPCNTPINPSTAAAIASAERWELVGCCAFYWFSHNQFTINCCPSSPKLVLIPPAHKHTERLPQSPPRCKTTMKRAMVRIVMFSFSYPNASYFLN